MKVFIGLAPNFFMFLLVDELEFDAQIWKSHNYKISKAYFLFVRQNIFAV
jgi:hypothetical protein